jgi:hypothetical protein
MFSAQTHRGISPGYSIFGIGVDRKHTPKWLFPQEKATFHGAEKVYMYSENALEPRARLRISYPFSGFWLPGSSKQ